MIYFDVSIVIINYNSFDYLYNCLNSIFKTTHNIHFEIIVIDNNSTIGSFDKILKYFPAINIIMNSSNYGIAHANNQGVRVARGKYVLILNPDTLIKENAIENIYKIAESKFDVAVVGCKIFREDGTVDASCSSDPNIYSFLISIFYLDKLFSKHPYFGKKRLTFWNYNSEREVDAVCGCFMLIRSIAFEHVGLFDESYFMYMEELDWCRRARLANWKIIFSPAGEIVHYGAGSSRDDETEVWERHCQSEFLYFQKHYGKTQAIIFRIFLVPWLLMRIFVCSTMRFISMDRNQMAIEKWKMYFKGLRWSLNI